VETPFPETAKNLEVELRKIRSRAANGKPVTIGVAQGQSELGSKMIIFLARGSREGFGKLVKEQREILDHLSAELKGQAFDTRTRRVCLMSIAAQNATAQRVQGNAFLNVVFGFNMYRW
jgi:hypothetical protein